MTKEKCTVGKIIRAAVHEQDFNHRPGFAAAEVDTQTVMSKAGPVYSKVRWMIIVRVLANHYLTIPLYTHNGTGLSNKTDSDKLEYTSVRDLRHRGEFEALSKNKTLKAEMDPGHFETAQAHRGPSNIPTHPEIWHVR